MAFTRYSKAAVKALKRMPVEQARRMQAQLREIAVGNETGKDIRRLQGRTELRLRMGAYRAVYRKSRDGIVIIRIGPRGGIYK